MKVAQCFNEYDRLLQMDLKRGKEKEKKIEKFKVTLNSK